MAKKSTVAAAGAGGTPRGRTPQSQAQLSTPSPAARQPSPSHTTKPAPPPTTTVPPPSSAGPKPSPATSTSTDPTAILQSLYATYLDTTPQRIKLLDTFLLFLVAVGALQFVYCVVAGNYPFNAFLAGFGATVGQFVLTVSLRIQVNPENKAEFESVSHERAFADYVFGSLLLHFLCVNFIN